MTKDLLWRGMLAGILAALICTLFARAVAEPQVDHAIGFEATHEAHAHHDHGHDEEEVEIFSRATQKGPGLLTAMALYGAAIGGIFSLLFAYAYGRLAQVGPRTLAAALAMLAFVVIAVVPALKYPPNPPAVGQPDTIQIRTAAYFAMLIASVVATVVAFRVKAMLAHRLGGFDAVLAGVASYVVVIVIAQALLPRFDEVPADFPASLLWQFRLSALGIQALLWTTIGLSFGLMAERRLRRESSRN
ncbi:CbtA family protein [Sphingomonas sp. PR090111-T3T-6A]|uniref:CbtA family protein n=1 Tax=Sphingomonas sp. PR090111-T3T-6A TaxID=685778 RepID=UPI00037B8B3F|nr:CbtA family protein [Sphingomonas sp. PR090111-T3T-6A]